MKPRMLDKVLSKLFIFVMLIVSAFLLIVSLNLGFLDEIAISILHTFNGGANNLILFIISIVLAVISIILLFSSFRTKKSNSSLLKTTDLGSIHVSVSSLDNLTQRAVRSFDSIKDVKSAIIPGAEGIKILLRITIMPEVKMPELTTSIQLKVKEYVEELSGISVNQVQIYIDQLSTAQKSQ